MNDDEIHQIEGIIEAKLAVHVYECHKGRRAKKFTPPTRDEVVAYAKELERQYLALDVDKFMDFYESKGWKVGSQPMTDWKAAARRAVRGDGWCRHEARQRQLERLRAERRPVPKPAPKEPVATPEQRRQIAASIPILARRLAAPEPPAAPRMPSQDELKKIGTPPVALEHHGPHTWDELEQDREFMDD